MTIPNSSVTLGTGDIVATHTVGGVELQVVMLANADGHIWGTNDTYIFQTALAAGATNKLYLDVFNATGSGKTVKVRKLFCMSNSAAVVGVPIQWSLIRTTAVGTGGTALTAGEMVSSTTIPTQITARHAATGGATSGAALYDFYTTSEETIAANGMAAFINQMFEGDRIAPLTLEENEGFKLLHVTNSTTGSWVVQCVITVE